MILHTIAECLFGCGTLAEGRTGDPLQGRKNPGWTRTDEVDAVAAKHARTHPTRCWTEPEEAK